MAETKTPSEKLSSVKDLETRFKVSDKTIYRWVNSGQIEAITMGRQLRFEESEVKRFMDLRRRTRNRQERTTTRKKARA